MIGWKTGVFSCPWTWSRSWPWRSYGNCGKPIKSSGQLLKVILIHSLMGLTNFEYFFFLSCNYFFLNEWLFQTGTLQLICGSVLYMATRITIFLPRAWFSWRTKILSFVSCPWTFTIVTSFPKQIFVAHFVDTFFSIRKQPTFRDTTPGFLTKWRLRNEGRTSTDYLLLPRSW